MLRSACILFIVFLTGCDTSQKVDRSAIKEEMANREIKKVTEAEIISETLKEGQEIIKNAENLLKEKSREKLADIRRTHSIDSNLIEWVHHLDTLEEAHDAEINFLNFTSNLESPSVEQEILEAYNYDLEQGNTLNNNVQKLKDGYLLYTSPLTISDGSCLRCHSSEGRKTAPHISDFIDSNYPKSPIMNFKEGDVMGMWSVKILQKRIIQKF